jgi:hypothetical protein
MALDQLRGIGNTRFPEKFKARGTYLKDLYLNHLFTGKL